MTDKFETIAQNYDQLWWISADYHSWLINNILSFLDLRPEDRFADIGGGTGAYTEAVRSAAGLVRPAYCVEPSSKMLEQAARYEEIVKIESEGEAFFERFPRLDKVLFKESIHHVQDRSALWKSLMKNSPDSRSLIITRPQRPGFPLFEKAYQKFARFQPSIEELGSEIEESGFSFHEYYLSWPVAMLKKRWYDMVRSRFISDLYDFTDAQLESGIDEIDGQFDGETIEFNDDLIFLVVNKHA